MTATPRVLVETTRNFLARHAPFASMQMVTLEAMIPHLQLAYFPDGADILAPRMGPVPALHIVYRGHVGSRQGGGGGEHDATLAPGECFPVGALSAGTPTTRTYYGVGDTFCYLLPRERFLELRRISPEFERFCTQAITETLRQSLAQLQVQYSQLAAEQQTLSRPVADLVKREPIACLGTATLREALEKMHGNYVRTIAVVDEAGAPCGILTLIDLLGRVVLPGRSLDTPVSAVMSAPMVTVAGNAIAHEAMHLMADRGVRQLAVVGEGGRLVGLVSERDLFALQRVSMRQVSQGLRDATTFAELHRRAGEIRGLARNLLAQGVGAEPLTRTIAALNDALTRQAITLVLRNHRLNEVQWCWMALGSEGRSEQTLATDQDNAIVFADDCDVDAVRAKLLAFANEANENLADLGFPLCPGEVMARNPGFCLTLGEWKAKFMGWLGAPTPEALLQANIMFDFRALYGEGKLVDALRTWLFAYTPDNAPFLRLMGRNALEVTPPLGLVRTFATDESAEHKGTLDLKTRGTRLFVDAARAFALALAIPEPGTATRLREAGERLGVNARHVEATVDAFHYLQLLRLRRQDMQGEHAADNRIDPETLNEIEQRMLKEAFRQARTLQQRLAITLRL